MQQASAFENQRSSRAASCHRPDLKKEHVRACICRDVMCIGRAMMRSDVGSATVITRCDRRSGHVDSAMRVRAPLALHAEQVRDEMRGSEVATR